MNLRKGLNEALRLISEKLDLDETRYKNADEKYHSVANWLSADQSLLETYKPEIYPQGSFMLGTVVKPKSSEEYDLDFVCQLNEFDGQPAEIKEILGDRLKENERYHSPVLEEKNRCWRINYAGEFHMDILPARSYKKEGLRNTSIEVPDKQLGEWIISDPRGYHDWFYLQMQEAYTRKLEFIAESEQKSIDEIQRYRIKTTLQQAIQLLKRNRDIIFENDIKDKPISIIISTLAAQSYQNQEDLFDTLVYLVDNMSNFIKHRDGIVWVENPVNSDENFAEKWYAHPQRQEKFVEWLEKLETTLVKLDLYTGVEEAQGLLSALFGEKLTANVIRELKDEGILNNTFREQLSTVRIEPNKPWGQVICF